MAQNECTAEVKIPKRILNTLLSSLTAGVVPRIGAPYIAIGRQEEIGTLLDNLADAEEGGSFCRFLIGRYGSGKSFLIQLLRGYALERGFLTADADLSPERRLNGTNGYGIATYRELLIHLACKAAPDGGALPILLSRYYVSLTSDLAQKGIYPESENFEASVRSSVVALLANLEGDVGGFDFSRVLGEYFVASVSENELKKSACLRWLRGEYANKTEAAADLGFRVSTVIADDNWYDFIKLFSALSVHLGYSGLILFIDECVNLYKIPNRISREANYEKILSIFNDTLQGRASHLGVIFGGTPQFLEDPRRGVFSYDALKSRLEDSKYTRAGYQNLSSPVIRLRRLSDNELLALVRRLSKLFAMREGIDSTPISDEDTVRFLQTELARAGAEELVTPREIIRDFLTVLSILHEHPEASFDALLGANLTSSASESEAEQKSRSGITISDIEI